MSASDVADTILEQLGGRRFVAMTGARQFTYSHAERGALSMILTAGKAKRVTITLTHLDTYTLTAWSRSGTVKAHTEGLTADQLESVFTSATGLSTRL